MASLHTTLPAAVHFELAVGAGMTVEVRVELTLEDEDEDGFLVEVENLVLVRGVADGFVDVFDELLDGVDERLDVVRLGDVDDRVELDRLLDTSDDIGEDLIEEEVFFEIDELVD